MLTPIYVIRCHVESFSQTIIKDKVAALSSATQHAMPPEFGIQWGTECLNIRYPAVCGIQREVDLFYNKK